jgi:hypothetical protein
VTAITVVSAAIRQPFVSPSISSICLSGRQCPNGTWEHLGVTKDGIAVPNWRYRDLQQDLLQGSPSGFVRCVRFPLGGRPWRPPPSSSFCLVVQVVAYRGPLVACTGMRSNHRRRAVLDLSQSNRDSPGAPKQTTFTLSINCRAFDGQADDDASISSFQLGPAGLLLSSEPALPVCRLATSMLFSVAGVVKKHESSLTQIPSITGSRVQSPCPCTLSS